MRNVLIILFCLIVADIHAQELWVRPEKYFYEQNEVAHIDFVTGSDFIAEPAPRGFSWERLELNFRNGITDIRRKFTDGDKPHYEVNLASDGIYKTIGVSPSQTMRLGKSAFLRYAKEYGLEEIHQDSTALTADSVTVKRTQVIKTYLRVGKQFDRRPETPENLGLEIIPDKNPLLLNRGERITFTVLKGGKPAFGVRVKIWNRWNNRTTLQHIYTEKNGTVNTTISSPGDWMVSVVDLRSTGQNQFEGQSFNLVFGYR